MQNTALLANQDLIISVTKPKILFAMEISRVLDVVSAATKEYTNIGKQFSPNLKFIINEFYRGLSNDTFFLEELRMSFEHDENLKSTELLKTVIPFKRKFFESYYLDKIFAH